MSSLPCGTRNYDYAEDMAIVRTKTQWALLIGFLIVLFAAPLYLGNLLAGHCQFDRHHSDCGHRS